MTTKPNTCASNQFTGHWARTYALERLRQFHEKYTGCADILFTIVVDKCSILPMFPLPQTQIFQSKTFSKDIRLYIFGYTKHGTYMLRMQAQPLSQLLSKALFCPPKKKSPFKTSDSPTTVHQQDVIKYLFKLLIHSGAFKNEHRSFPKGLIIRAYLERTDHDHQPGGTAVRKTCARGGNSRPIIQPGTYRIRN